MRILLFLCICFLGLNIQAQKKDLSLEDAVIGQWQKFRPETINRFSWVKNSPAYSYVSADSIYVTGIDSVPSYVIPLDALKKSHEELKNLVGIPSFNWTNNNTFVFKKDSIFYEFNTEEKRSYHLFTVTNGGANLDFCAENYMAAYTKGNNLLIATIEGDIAVSDVNIDNIVYGQVVHRHEFGISKGTFWSPQGRRLAYYRKDERAVSDYPLVNLNSKPAASQIIKYPMAGDSSHTVTLGVYDLATNTNVFLRTGLPKDQYLTNVQWSPDESKIYVAILNRDQNYLKLNAYSADSGLFKGTVYEEKASTYIQPLHPMVFLPNKPNKFIWRSEKDGFDNLYLHDLMSDSVVQLSYGPDVVMENLGFSSNGDFLYYTQTSEYGLGRRICRVHIDSLKTDTLSDLSGVYRAIFSESANALFVNYSDTATPGLYYIHNLNTLNKDTLLQCTNKLDSFNIGQTKLFHLWSKDSIPLNTRLILPSNLDSSKRYPALIYVYNGPGVQLITNSWLAQSSLWMNHLAEKGFVVLTIDGRGSENRGRDFEQATFRRLGELEIEDQLLGAAYLKSLSYVDSTKLAVHGWSYGGFMATSLMLKTPGHFKVAVAGGPVTDWKFYEIMYTERYMDTPQSNPEGYQQTSLLNKVDQLEGDLLIIHGSIDDVVVPQHSMALLKACIEKGIQIDFFTYPMHPHNVRGRDRIHLMDKVIRYIEDKLEVDYTN